jgi:serine/threonine-protein kinase RsbW
VVLDGQRVRRARLRAGLTQAALARQAGVSQATVSRLEGQYRPCCLFRTRTRLARAIGLHPQAITADTSSHPEASRDSGPGPGGATRVFAGRPDQISAVRAFARQALGGGPATDDAVLICSELATNAVRHSRSGRPGGQFTVRIDTQGEDHTWIEVHDQGGPWTVRDDSPGGRGLAIVARLASPWDIRGDDAQRVICAQLNWPK